MTFKRIISKPTFIFILSLILLLIGIPYGIYGLTLDGGASLGGALILMADFVIFIALLIDRAIVNKISPIRLSIYEFVFLVLCIMIYLHSQRKLIVDIENDNVEYLLVIQNPGNLINNETHLKFPFNKILSTKKSIVIVDKMPKHIDFNVNADWNKSYYYNRYEFEKYPKVTFFCKTSLDFKRDMNQDLIDSLINKE
jgi:hypothetical protein